MIFHKLFKRRSAGRELALVGIEKRRRSVNDVAQQIRREIGLPPATALTRRQRVVT